MTNNLRLASKIVWILGAFSLALLFAAVTLLLARSSAQQVRAAYEQSNVLSLPQAPIPPPQGYPKLSLSVKVVSPELAHIGGETLHYRIEIINTGAWQADGVTMVDALPVNVTYNNNAESSVYPQPVFSQGALTWNGDVGFDQRVVISFSVDVDEGFSGEISNTATITHPDIPAPVNATATALVTDDPVFTIVKTSTPEKPGPGKPLTYALEVTNIGQPVDNLELAVKDVVPENTSVLSVGPDGQVTPNGQEVNWTRSVSLVTGASSVFTFIVEVAGVPSGTVIRNEQYQVSSELTGVSAGELYTVTAVNPELFISKTTWPDPPGSNRELTYTLVVLNRGSLATGLEISDRLPVGVEYRRGGTYQNGKVLWDLPLLDTGEAAYFSYTVYVGDVAQVYVNNDSYGVCSAEGVCAAGDPLASLVDGPTFSADLWLDPVAKKPGGGTGPVTPTLVLQNLGPGSALDATARLIFQRISVSYNDLLQDPPIGQFSEGPDCGEKCVSYIWTGDLAVNQVVTITTIEGQSSVGGEEGTHYTATVVMTDQLGAYNTPLYTATVTGTITHFPNLIPSKSAPEVIGAGQVMTYMLQVYNSGLSTDESAFPPVLTDTVPASTTLVRVNDGGTATSTGAGTVVSWELPSMSPGDRLYRSFAVQVDPSLVSGTLVINRDYAATWYSSTLPTSNWGDPVTTTVREVGLIDSYKTVTPTVARPGPDNLLTYTVHVVNSSPIPLAGVQVVDIMPWEHSTYQRDAKVSAGELVSDIVSLSWSGDLAPESQALITFSVLVDDGFSGPLTNTATIEHSSLISPVVATAVAYITDQPVLRLWKTASPDLVAVGEELLYTLHIQNLGQQATILVVTDTLPVNVEFVPGSASSGGQLISDPSGRYTVRWTQPLLAPGESLMVFFRARVLGGPEVVNSQYRVVCAEGVSAAGPPVVTKIDSHFTYLPTVFRQ